MSLLNSALGKRQTKNVKLLEKDLGLLVQYSTKMVRSRYENMILPYQKRSVKKLFQDEAVEVNNWSSKKKVELLS